MNGPGELPLGMDECGQPVTITFDDLARHVLCRGTSGSGKSRWLEGLLLAIRKRQLQGRSVSLVVVDPVGEIFSALKTHHASQLLASRLGLPSVPPSLRAAWRSRLLEQTQKTHFLDFSDPGCNGLRLNPFQLLEGERISDCVSRFLRAAARLVGDFKDMRRMANVLRSASTCLLGAGGAAVPPTLQDVADFLLLSAAESAEFLQRIERTGAAVRGGSEPQVPPFVRRYAQRYLSGKGWARQELVASSLNLLSPYLASETISTFLGSPFGNLDMPSVVNGGGTLACHLPRQVGPLAQRGLGGLLIDLVESICRTRRVEDVKAGRLPQVILVIDEFVDFFDEQWGATISQCRNYGLSVVLAHQTSAQLQGTPEGASLLATTETNTAVQLYFRLDLDSDGVRISHRLFKPRGQMVNRVETEVTRTEGESSSTTITSSITEQVSVSMSEAKNSSRTFSVGEGKTISVGRARGVSHVRAEGVSVSRGRGFSQIRTKGVSITQTRSHTYLKARGQSEGESESTSSSESESFGDGESTGVFTGHGVSLPVGLDGLSGGALPQSGSKRSQNHGRSTGASSSHSHSIAGSLARAVSRVVSQSEALGQGVSEGESQSRSTSTGVSQSVTRSESQSVARGLSQVLTLARSLAQTCSRGETHGNASSRTRGRSRARARGKSTMTGRSSSTSTRESTTHYGVGDEAKVRGYELAELPPRTAWVTIRGARAVKMTTFDVADHFPTRLGPIDGMKLLADLTRPAPPTPAPTEPFDRRLAAALFGRGSQDLSFHPPSPGSASKRGRRPEKQVDAT